MRFQHNILRAALLCSTALAVVLQGVTRAELDDTALSRLIDVGSTRLQELERQHNEVKNDKEQRDFASAVKAEMDAERRRCNDVKSAAKALLAKVKKNGKIDTRDEKGRTLLMLMAGLGNDAATEMVLRENPDLTIMDHHDKIAYDYERRGGGSAIANYLGSRWVQAMERMDKDAVQMLLSCGASPDWPVGGEPPLGVAINAGDSAMFDMLMFAGAGAKSSMQDGTPLIELAVNRHDDNALPVMLNALGEVNPLFKDGRSLFRHLLGEDDAACLCAWMTVALEKKPAETEAGTAYLNLVVRLAHPAGVGAVAQQYKKYLNDEDTEGNLPLFEAARRGNVEIYKALIACGADVRARNSRGETVLMHAALSASPQMLAEVLANVPQEIIQASDNAGHNAHYYAKLAKDAAAGESLKAAGLQPK